jgi:hypothetical protein
MTDSQETKKVLSYDLLLNGVYGRNRKSKRVSLHICDSETKLDPKDLSPKAASVLAAAKPKSGCLYKVVETPTDVTRHVGSDGTAWAVRTFLMFSGVTVDQGVAP